MFKPDGSARPPGAVARHLVRAGGLTAVAAAAMMLTGLVAAGIGSTLQPVAVPPEMGGGTEWQLPAWASVAAGVGGLAVPLLWWGLAARWVGRVLQAHASGLAAGPEAAQWLAGAGASLTIAALAQVLLAALVWSVPAAWGVPTLSLQGLLGIWAVPVGGVAMLLTMAGAIWWSLATPSLGNPSAPRPAGGVR